MTELLEKIIKEKTEAVNDLSDYFRKYYPSEITKLEYNYLPSIDGNNLRYEYVSVYKLDATPILRIDVTADSIISLTNDIVKAIYNRLV